MLLSYYRDLDSHRIGMTWRVSIMRTIRVSLAALLLLPLASIAQETDYSKIEIKVTHVSGNIYLLQGGDGGNMAASVGEDGIVLVDDEFAPLAAKIAAALKNIGVTDKPVRFVINTHYHFDHTGGNLPFANQGSTIIAHDNVRTRLASGGTTGNGGSLHFDAEPANSTGLPEIPVDHDVSGTLK